MNEESENLNKIIKTSSPIVYDLLSDKGKEIYFPKKGILTQAAEAKGKKINATIGVALEDDGSPLVLSTISTRVLLPKLEVFDYAPSAGNIELRKKWKDMMLSKNPSLLEKNISMPIVTAALTHGLMVCGYMFCDKKDTILIPEPFWENYGLIFQNAYGAKIKPFPIFKKRRFNIEDMKKKLLDKGEKKILLLNFPNNPTGYTPMLDEVSLIISSIKEASDSGKKIVVLIDDAYNGFVYEDDVYKESLFTRLCDLSENVLAVKIDGPTKEDYAWGLRVGFLTYGIKDGSDDMYAALVDKTAGAIRGSISNAPQISQSLILQSFKDENYAQQKLDNFDILKKRYVRVLEIFLNHKEYKKYFQPLPFNSGYFICIETKDDAELIRSILLEQYDTGVIVFAKNIMRLAYSAVAVDKLEMLFDNLYSACKQAGERDERNEGDREQW